MLLSCNYRELYSETTNSNSTTTLISTSNQQQHFLGILPQTIVLPPTNTMLKGQTFRIVNRSNSNLTVQSSGLILITIILPGLTVVFDAIDVTIGNAGLATSWTYFDNISSCIVTTKPAGLTSVCTNVNDATEINGTILNTQSIKINNAGVTGLGYSTLANNSNIYYTGVASQTGTTITGIGTTFKSSMIGGTLVFANLVQAKIIGFTNGTTITASVSQTIANQTYKLYFGNVYNAYTAGQSGTTVTGSNTSWLGLPQSFYDLTNGYIIFSNLGAPAQIINVNSDTSLTVNISQTIASGTIYTIYYGGVNNTTLGFNSLKTSEFASNCVSLGEGALSSGNLNSNGIIAVGQNALANNGGNNLNNLAMGTNALKNFGPADFISPSGATVSQTGITLTCVGTTFSQNMEGGTLVFANFVHVSLLTYVNPTTFTVPYYNSQTVTSQAFVIYYSAVTSYGPGFSQSNDIVTWTQPSCGSFYGFSDEFLEGASVLFADGKKSVITSLINPGYFSCYNPGMFKVYPARTEPSQSGSILYTPKSNLAIGNNALVNSVLSSANIAIGDYSMNSNTAGGSNIGLGSKTLRNNTTGTSNIAIGEKSMYNNISGFNNTAVGQESLRQLLNGSNNSCVGAGSGVSNVEGSNNVSLGSYSVYSSTSNYGLTGIGNRALFNVGSIENFVLGTASQTGTIVTLNGYLNLFINPGSTIVFANGLIATVVSSISSPARDTLNVIQSQTVTNQKYRVFYSLKSYNMGTVSVGSSQSSFSPTGSDGRVIPSGGALFTSDMIGGIIIFSTGNHSVISDYISAIGNVSGILSIADTSFLVPTNTTYIIYYGGANNSAVGNYALGSIKYGNSNTVLGYNAMKIYLNGEDNVGVGSNCMAKTSASYYSFTGDLNFQTTINEYQPKESTFVGSKSGTNVESCYAATGIGYNALNGSSSMTHSTGIGHNAMIKSGGITYDNVSECVSVVLNPVGTPFPISTIISQADVSVFATSGTLSIFTSAGIQVVNYTGVTHNLTHISVLSNNVALPTSIINVDSTAGFASSGVIYINSGGLITYTGKTATSFTGCTGGFGTLYAGVIVLFDTFTGCTGGVGNVLTFSQIRSNMVYSTVGNFTNDMIGGMVVFSLGNFIAEHAVITSIVSPSLLTINSTPLASQTSTASRILYGKLYNTGTISQTGTTVTGIGTNFTSDMVGGNIVFEPEGFMANIVSVDSPTSLTVNISQTAPLPYQAISPTSSVSASVRLSVTPIGSVLIGATITGPGIVSGTTIGSQDLSTGAVPGANGLYFLTVANPALAGITVTVPYNFEFNGTITSSTSLTVNFLYTSSISIGATITGTGVTVGTKITGFVSGIMGGAGVYTITSSTTTGAIRIGGNNTSVPYSLYYGGSFNTGVGSDVAQNLRSGTSNTILGYNAASTLNTGSNNIVIGANATTSSANTNNEITLGDTNIALLRANGSSQFGSGVVATAGLFAMAHGLSTTPGNILASGEGSHAEGKSLGTGTITAPHNASHAEGFAQNGTKIIAWGDGSYAGGFNSASIDPMQWSRGCYPFVSGNNDAQTNIHVMQNSRTGAGTINLSGGISSSVEYLRVPLNSSLLCKLLLVGADTTTDDTLTYETSFRVKSTGASPGTITITPSTITDMITEGTLVGTTITYSNVGSVTSYYGDTNLRSIQIIITTTCPNVSRWVATIYSVQLGRA